MPDRDAEAAAARGEPEDHDHEPDHDHGHEHGHSHSAHSVGGWSDWRRTLTLQIVVAAIGVAAVATAIGVIALWPSDGGRDAAVSAADEIGIVNDRLAARVTGIEERPCSYSTRDLPQFCRIVTFEPSEGPDAGDQIALPESNLENPGSINGLSISDKIVVGYEESTDFYFFADRDRRTSLAWLAILFGAIVVAFGRLRGLLALLAMVSTILVLVVFVGPSVLDGNDPVLVAIVAAAAIAFVGLYLTHGVNPGTTIALAGTLGALALTFGLSWAFFEIARFTGLATEEALILPFIAEDIDVAGLLLGGAVIGALGALDDVTVTQVATVAEIGRQNPSLTTAELTSSGIRVGREHIASTVNTLLLAYAGASLPLLLLFALTDQPLVMIANSELIAVEIVRTLCGSIGLIAAVPITTALAASVLRPADPDTEAAVEDAEPLDRPDPNEPEAVADPVVSAEPVAPTRPPRWEDFAPRET